MRGWFLLFAFSFLLAAPLARLVAQQPAVSVAEAEATRPGIPPAPVPPSELLGWQFTFGILANELMRWLKGSLRFTWIRDGAGGVNVAVAALLAAVAAAGIHTEFDSAAGVLTVTGLTLTSVLHFGGEWLRQYVLQYFTWRAMKDRY